MTSLCDIEFALFEVLNSTRTLLSTGSSLLGFARCARAQCAESAEIPELSPYVKSLTRLEAEWLEKTAHIGKRASVSPDEVGAGSVDYLIHCDYFYGICVGEGSQTALMGFATDIHEQDFYRAKLKAAHFYLSKFYRELYHQLLAWVQVPTI